MPAAISITADQRDREQSIAFAIAMDVGIVAVMLLVAVAGGSLTLMAESIRGGLGVLPEAFTYAVLRRLHRDELIELDFGAGKLEQVANLTIAAGMLLGAVWIAIGALQMLSGSRPLGTPMGLALAAIAEMSNIYINLLAWDGVRRAAGPGDSLLMKAQLVQRRTKLFASVVVGVGLTIAALSTDDVIVAWADALGSLFVAAYMTRTGWQVLGEALPDLLDHSAGAGIEQQIDSVLATHAGQFARVRRVRSRRSGHTAFVEIALEFEASLTMAEVDRRITSLKASLHQSLDNLEIAIEAAAAG